MLRNNLEDHPWVSTIGYTMLYVGYGLILVAFVQTPANRSGGLLGRFFASPPARFTAAIGAYSYSIYVWHLSLGRHPAQSLADWPRMASLDPTLRYFLCTAAYVAMAIIFGVILGKLIEFPALALRDRLFPSRASALRP
jgi:peptidoglycan/LPS O-acetylase OafA/YrhL